jgi:hypothetical protein
LRTPTAACTGLGFRLPAILTTGAAGAAGLGLRLLEILGCGYSSVSESSLLAMRWERLVGSASVLHQAGGLKVPIPDCLALNCTKVPSFFGIHTVFGFDALSTPGRTSLTNVLGMGNLTHMLDYLYSMSRRARSPPIKKPTTKKLVTGVQKVRSKARTDLSKEEAKERRWEHNVSGRTYRKTDPTLHVKHVLRNGTYSAFEEDPSYAKFHYALPRNKYNTKTSATAKEFVKRNNRKVAAEYKRKDSIRPKPSPAIRETRFKESAKELWLGPRQNEEWGKARHGKEKLARLTNKGHPNRRTAYGERILEDQV